MGVLATLSVRDGALIGRNEFMLSAEAPTSAEDMLGLILSYYENGITVPREILIDFEASDEDTELLGECLSLVAERKVTVRHPERGDGRALCDMARENAAELLRQYKLTSERENKSLTRLGVLLGLDYTPTRIEAYDISNIGDENIVASMVVCENGKMKKSDYRSFKINTTDGRDDYGSMKEALTRRLMHIGDGSASLGERPDLILLDGGDGHVCTVKPVLESMGIDVPVFGKVKDDYHKTRAITDGSSEISIAQEMNVYAFVYTLQEEAHRFAYKTSQKGKERSLTRSSLEKIDGIGPSKAKKLLSQMSLSQIREADPTTLKALKGISERDANNIYEYYKAKKKGH
jgi:excinuclease ABC subunit C